MRFTKLNSIFFVANVLLLGFAGYLFYARPWGARGSAVPEPGSPALANADENHAEKTEPVPPTIVTVTNNLTWAQLESEDYRAYIQLLRAVVSPEQTIRDIIIADLDKLIAP